jgi:hypothetical protein
MERTTLETEACDGDHGVGFALGDGDEEFS